MNIPLTVPEKSKKTYQENYLKITKNKDRLFLFAGDQKIEHLNKDFYGKNISSESNNPEHLFKIASKSGIGAFATQLGLISMYGADYKNINYIVKLNSKTDLIKTEQAEPISALLNTIDQVIEFQKNSKLSIVGVGYTLYLGSEHESTMLNQASQIIYQAHQHGLITVIWIYPRGKAVKNELSPEIISGAAGVGASLGADFIKLNPPKAKSFTESAKLLKQTSQAAGRTKIICSGGKLKNETTFLKELKDQIKIGNTSGCATGRNIHQKDLNMAIKFCNKISEIIYK